MSRSPKSAGRATRPHDIGLVLSGGRKHTGKCQTGALSRRPECQEICFNLTNGAMAYHATKLARTR